MYECVCVYMCNNSDNQNPPTRTPKKKDGLQEITGNEEEKKKRRC